MTDLPEGIDGAYPDRGDGDKAHQQHHDALHAETHNALQAIPDGQVAGKVGGQVVGVAAGEPAGAVADHEGAADPHGQYLTDASGVSHDGTLQVGAIVRVKALGPPVVLEHSADPAGGGGGVLASYFLNPVSGTLFSTTNVVPNYATDPTRYRVSFAAPASGKVIVRGTVGLRRTAGTGFVYATMVDTDTGAQVHADARVSGRQTTADPLAAFGFLLAGLTPGTTYNWALGLAVQTAGATAEIRSGFSAEPSLLEVIAA